MNWFMDMLLLFMEWALLMLIPLLLGILIGWAIWGRKCKNCCKENGELKERIKVLEGDTTKVKEDAETVTREVKADVNDDLSAIKGLDGDTADKLKSKGITSYQDLALLSNEKVDELESEFGFEGDRIRTENWVPQAAQLHFENYGEEIYDKVKVDAVYADAFEAQLAEAKKGVVLDYVDDLKIISGVGPKMEKLLNDFGITTFYHLSKLNDEGVKALNDKMEFFPGRIQRDDWIGQAKDLFKKMH